MQNIRVTCLRASFTVEAAFVMSIVIWVVIAVCYLAMFTHDETALYSLGQNYLEMSLENGAEYEETEWQQELRRYVGRHLFITEIKNVSIQKKLMSVKADITFGTSVKFPLIGNLYEGKNGGKVSLSHEVLLPAEFMWSSEQVKNIK